MSPNFSGDTAEFAALEARLKTILPDDYQDRYDDVQPVSMGSAALQYEPNGKVAWDGMWSTFCDLAMAGGPPHKGTLLEPGREPEIGIAPERYQQIADEICRGVLLVTGLPAYPSSVPGWVSVDFANQGAADWLARAITMENVAARCDRMRISLPAGPAYRVEKEIKNVITAVAKAAHYWFGHMQASRRREIAALFAEMEQTSPLVQPALAGYDPQPGRRQWICGRLADGILKATGLRAASRPYAGWLGLDCPSVHAAIWMMRGLVASNIFSRREETILFVPVNPLIDPQGDITLRALTRVHGFAAARGVL